MSRLADNPGGVLLLDRLPNQGHDVDVAGAKCGLLGGFFLSLIPFILVSDLRAGREPPPRRDG